MFIKPRLIAPSLCLLFAVSAIGEEESVPVADTPATPSVAQNESWSSFLPLMADEAYDQGYELPLPFGVGLNFVTLKRGIEVTEKGSADEF